MHDRRTAPRRSPPTNNGFRVAKDGRFTGFIYYDKSLKKNVRVGSEAGWPDNVFTLDEAMAARGRILGRINSDLLIAKKRMDWQNKYHKFDSLIVEYEAYAKKKAVNSWSCNMSNLKNYTFYWFLNQKALNIPSDWSWHYDDFTEWLLSEKPMKSSRKLKLSKNTINNIINATNAFLTFLEKKHRMGPFMRIDKLQIGKEERRGLQAIYSEKEKDDVERELRAVDQKFGTCFRLLTRTGIRPNEALGLHVGSVVVGTYPDEKKALFRKITDVGMEFYGFILLTDQPSLPSIYDKEGHVPRKPLKHRDEIAPKHNRYIPIIDETLAHELHHLRLEAKKGADDEEGGRRSSRGRRDHGP